MESTAFKNWYDNKAVVTFADRVAAHFESFDRATYERTVLAKLDALEMKDRVKLMATTLKATLPLSYEESVRGFVDLLGEPGDTAESNWADFKVWPLTMYVNLYGVHTPEVSLDALYHLTQRFSGEFAIRPLLLAHPGVVLSRLDAWVRDESEHVRRLASEGTRPRLPWGKRLQPFIEDPSPVIKVLEALRKDTSEYVRRSVANNLNDISKDHPEVATRVCTKWLKEVGEVPDTHPTYRMVRHALRSLVKAGDAGALEALGYRPDAAVSLSGLEVSEVVDFGGALELSFALHSESERQERLVVDFVIHHVKANGKRTPKTFKLKNVALGPGATTQIKKRHPMRPITTRKYYAGKHKIDVVVNGRTLDSMEFELRM